MTKTRQVRTARTKLTADLPFVGVSIDRENECFSCGPKVEIIPSLPHPNDMKIVARTGWRQDKRIGKQNK